MKLTNVKILLLLLSVSAGLTVYAAEVELDLIGGTFGRAKPIVDLYNEGVDFARNGNVVKAVETFKKVRDAKVSNMQDYVAKIKALEYLISYYRIQNDTNRVNEYSRLLVKFYDEAFSLAHISADSTERSYGRKIATILNDMLKNNGSYISLDQQNREIALASNIVKFIENNRENYLKRLGSSAADEFKGLQLDDALDLFGKGIIAYNRAEAISGESENELTQKNQLYHTALNLLLRASAKNAAIYNAELHLAKMYLKGLGTDRDLKVAQEHAQKALTSAQNGQKKDAQDLKNEVDAELLAESAFEKMNQAKELPLGDKQRGILEKEAFDLLQQANTLSAQNYMINFTLAEMYHDAIGTDYDPSRATGSLKLAKNAATTRKQKDEVESLQLEVDDRNAQVNQFLKNEKDVDNAGAYGRLGLGAEKSKAHRTEVMRRLFQNKLKQQQGQKHWMNRLFGTSKPRARVSSNVNTAGSSSSPAPANQRTSIWGFKTDVQ